MLGTDTHFSAGTITITITSSWHHLTAQHSLISLLLTATTNYFPDIITTATFLIIPKPFIKFALHLDRIYKPWRRQRLRLYFIISWLFLGLLSTLIIILTSCFLPTTALFNIFKLGHRQFDYGWMLRRENCVYAPIGLENVVWYIMIIICCKFLQFNIAFKSKILMIIFMIIKLNVNRWKSIFTMIGTFLDIRLNHSTLFQQIVFYFLIISPFKILLLIILTFVFVLIFSLLFFGFLMECVFHFIWRRGAMAFGEFFQNFYGVLFWHGVFFVLFEYLAVVAGIVVVFVWYVGG